MKKIIIVLAVIVFGIVLLPIIGNKVAEDTLKNRIEVLTSYGLEVQNSSTDSSYFTTKKHYEFLLKDSEKFVEYLNQFSDKQLPPYVSAMLGGVVIGTDLQYSNFPLSDTLSIDIYPLSLSTEMIRTLQNNDINFSQYITSFLKSKGVMYHINYNIIRSDFDGYIKDINEEYVLQDNSKVALQLLSATYSGSGPLIAPTTLHSNIKNISLKILKSSEELHFDLREFSSTSTFESQSTYASGAKIENLMFVLKESLDDNVTFSASDIHMNLSSNTQGENAEFYAKSSFNNLDLKSNNFTMKATDFNYDIALSEMDKDSLEELRVLLLEQKRDYSDALELQMKNSIVKLLSKGLTLSVADLSLKNIILNDTEDLGGLSVKAQIVLKEDATLDQNSTISPMILAGNTNLDMMFKISKPMFGALTQVSPVLGLSVAYAQEIDNEMIFHIVFDKQELRVNDKELTN